MLTRPFCLCTFGAMSWMKSIGFFAALILPALVVAGYTLGGVYVVAPMVLVFILIPLGDYWLGLDTSNVAKEEKPLIGEALYYRAITYLWVYVQLLFLVWCVYFLSHNNLTFVELALFALQVGLVAGGVGITVAHELGHKKSALEQFYSKVLLMTVYYMHFFIEHNRGHHVHVATPEDPATARKNQNFYDFWIQSVIGSYRHAWKIERESKARSGKSGQMLSFTVLPLVFGGVLWLFSYSLVNTWLWHVPVFFLLQSFFAFTLLELVNYVEHYGMMRRELAPGKFERVNPLHSWNASHLISNFFLFQLQRHSDHHYNAIKRYQVLDHYEASPQLPYGYPAMILIALVPPLWFQLMNPRLEHWQNQHHTFATA